MPEIVFWNLLSLALGDTMALWTRHVLLIFFATGFSLIWHLPNKDCHKDFPVYSALFSSITVVSKEDLPTHSTFVSLPETTHGFGHKFVSLSVNNFNSFCNVWSGTTKYCWYTRYAWKYLVVSRLSGQLRYAKCKFLNKFTHCVRCSLPLLRQNSNHVARTFSLAIKYAFFFV